MENKNDDAPQINHLSWLIGGAQGSGVDSSANIFSRACVLGGLWTYGLREYYRGSFRSFTRATGRNPHAENEVIGSDNVFIRQKHMLSIVAGSLQALGDISERVGTS